MACSFQNRGASVGFLILALVEGAAAQDACFQLAGENETLCAPLVMAGNRSWSSDKKVCHVQRQRNRTKDEGSEWMSSQSQYGEKDRGKHASVGCLGLDAAECAQLNGAGCTWFPERKVCYMKRHNVKGRNDWQEKDVCFQHAGENETLCTPLVAAGDCSWSSDKKVCHMRRHHNRTKDEWMEWQHGNSEDGKHGSFGCLGLAAAECEELADAGCIWSTEKKVCYIKRQNVEGSEWQDKDVCFQHAGVSETLCAPLVAAGNCSWSSDKKLCHARHQHAWTKDEWTEMQHGKMQDAEKDKGKHGSFGCLGLDAAECEELADAGCAWSTEKVCYLKRQNVKGRDEWQENDVCFQHAGENEALCTPLVAAGDCSWSSDKKVCHMRRRHNRTKDEWMEWQHGDSQDGKHGSFGCLGLDVAECEELADTGCIWSTEKKVCYMKRQNVKGRDEWQEKDVCFQRAGTNDTLCAQLVVDGKCRWSAEKKVCYMEWQNNQMQDKHDGFGHDSSSRCLALDKVQCGKQAAAGCMWSAGKDICFLKRVDDSAKDGSKDVVPGSATHGSATNVTVDFSFRLSNINYATLMARQNAHVLGKLLIVMKTLVANEAGDKVLAEHVDMSLSAGSLIVEVSIRPPASIAASSVQSNLGKSPQMLSQMMEGIRSVEGISGVSTGVISASFIATPTLHQAVAHPGPTPSESSGSSLIFVGASVGVFVVIGIIISSVCLVARRHRSEKKVKSPVVQGVVTDNAVNAYEPGQP